MVFDPVATDHRWQGQGHLAVESQYPVGQCAYRMNGPLVEQHGPCQAHCRLRDARGRPSLALKDIEGRLYDTVAHLLGGQRFQPQGGSRLGEGQTPIDACDR